MIIEGSSGTHFVFEDFLKVSSLFILRLRLRKKRLVYLL